MQQKIPITNGLLVTVRENGNDYGIEIIFSNGQSQKIHLPTSDGIIQFLSVLARVIEENPQKRIILNLPSVTQRKYTDLSNFFENSFLRSPDYLKRLPQNSGIYLLCGSLARGELIIHYNQIKS